MNETIIRNHNQRVKPDDVFYHLGDFCFKNSSDKKGEGTRTPAMEWESKLNGKIINILGNHDTKNNVKSLIIGALIKRSGHRIWLVHKPQHYNKNYEINFVAHVHRSWSIKLKGDHIFDKDGKIMVLESDLINVGVDVNNFMPQSFEKLIKKLNRYRKVNQNVKNNNN